MTNFLKDILRQPLELQRSLERIGGQDRATLEEAAKAVRGAKHVYLTGIGSSWHAALNIAALFHGYGTPVILQDASELLHFSRLAPGSVVVTLSRSGRSVEIVGLLEKARQENAVVVGVTNSPEGTLARQSDIPVCIPVPPDFGISVNTYSSLALGAGALAAAAGPGFDSELTASLSRALRNMEAAMGRWQDQIGNTSWTEPGATYYFLARGAGLGTCHEARLLWEEGVKSAATAMGTGGFRHGPQEMVAAGVRFGIWIDPRGMRAEDLAVARDLRSFGASVMVVGHDVPPDAGDLVCEMPETLPGWQFLCDIVPPQLAAERLARLSGVDSDTFRYCPFIVEDEYGLAPNQPTTAEKHK